MVFDRDNDILCDDTIYYLYPLPPTPPTGEITGRGKTSWSSWVQFFVFFFGFFGFSEKKKNMAGSAQRMRTDRELASKVQEEDDRLYALSLNGRFGGMSSLIQSSLHRVRFLTFFSRQLV